MVGVVATGWCWWGWALGARVIAVVKPTLVVVGGRGSVIYAVAVEIAAALCAAHGVAVGVVVIAHVFYLY